MKVILAAPRGYCAGVDMAIAALDRALQRSGPPIYAYHEVVHNRIVVAHFTGRGVIFVNDLDCIPDGATIFYSAHGVSPAVRSESARKRLNVIDATCPLVLKVHSEARRFARAGARLVLVGHAGHDEVVGVAGEVQGCAVVESVEDVDRLAPPDGRPIAYVTQTTLSTTETRSIVARLQERFPAIQSPPREDICYATTNRQAAVRAIAPQTELVIVIGSANSSNTSRLVEVARDCGVPAHRVDCADQIDFDWFANVGTCCVTAGASVPESIVAAAVEAIVERFDAEVEERVTVEESMRFAPPVLGASVTTV